MTRIRKHFIILTSLITVSFSLLLFVLFILLPIYFSNYHSNQLENQYHKMVGDLENKPISDILKEIEKEDIENEDVFLDVLNESGETIYPTYIDKEIKQSTQYYIENDLTEFSIWTHSLTSLEGRKLLIIGEFPFLPINDSKEILLTLCPIIFLIVLVFASVNAYLFSIMSNKRIKLISQASQEMRCRDPNLRCEVDGKDDLSELAEDINQLYKDLMATINELEISNEAIRRRENEKTEFLRMTAHELKTPLTSVIGLVDGMIYGIGSFKNREHYLQVCRKILSEHSDLVNTLLESTQYDNEVHKELYALNEVIESLLTPYYALSKIKNLTFEVELNQVNRSINKLYFCKMIKNILDNAFNYAKDGGLIRVSLTEEKLIISNNCDEVLNQDELKDVFKAFYRVEESRSKEIKGHGLGLYIVDKILKRHALPYSFYASAKDEMTFEINLTREGTEYNRKKVPVYFSNR